MKLLQSKKRIIVLILLVCSVFTCCTVASAADWCSDESPCSYCQKMNDIGAGPLKGFGECCWAVGATAMGANPHISVSRIAAGIYKFSSYEGKWLNTGGSTSLLKAGESTYNAMKVVGIALIFLYFLIELLDEVQADSFTVEHLIKKLITLAVAILVMEQGATIFRLIGELGDSLVDNAIEMGSELKQKSEDVEKLYDTLMCKSDDGFFSVLGSIITALGQMLKNLVAAALNLVVVIIFYLISFGRFIECLVRFTFAPIGLAQLVSGGSKSAGMRYIKKFASCVLQGAVMVMAIGASEALQGMTNELNGLIATIICPIILLGFIGKASRIADDIVGV